MEVTNTIPQKEYYKEVDGLRALAVLMVIFFHLNVSGFTGGFIGVDVFFVISGYLITKLLLEEFSKSGEVDYGLFFIRRSKRIFPALAVSLCATFYIAVAIFKIEDFKYCSGSIVYAVTGLSNIFFWKQAGYFDVGADLKPALHTWSLSVETQFYLVWPFIIVLIFRNFSRISSCTAIFLLGAGSLIANVIFTNDSFNVSAAFGRYLTEPFQNREASIFFLMPFRIFEFSIGACVVWADGYRDYLKRGSEISILAGLAMVFYAATQFNVNLVYPSFYALLPCFGAALILWSAKSSGFLGLVLRHPASVGLGLISYSLYLVHWPAIVFYKYVNQGTWGIFDKLFILVLSLIIATAMYRFIERPFRSIDVRSVPVLRHQFWGVCAVVLIVVGLPAAHSYTHNGWQWRFPILVADLLTGTSESLKASKVRASGCSFANFNDFDPASCIHPEVGKINVLLMGDSVASYIWMGLSENLPKDRYNILQLTPSNCRPGYEWGVDYCLQSNQFAFDFIAKNKIDLTIFASLGPDLNNLRSTIRYMKKVDRSVLIIGQPFIFTGRLTDIITAASTASTEAEIQDAARKSLLPNIVDLRQSIQKVAMEEEASYFDIQEQLCRKVDDISTCSFIVGNSLITADNNHLTPAASIRIFKKLAEDIRSKFDNLSLRTA